MSVLPPKLEHGPLSEEPPPILRTWKRIYLGVIGWLGLLIVLFYLFARTFSP
jgi:hypothetical protein